MADLTITIGTTFSGAELTIWADAGKTTPFELAGYTAYSEIRTEPNSPVVIDLLPTIDPADTDGLITIPSIDFEDTMDLPEGDFLWDIILEKDGIRLYPVNPLTVSIARPNTQPPIPDPPT